MQAGDTGRRHTRPIDEKRVQVFKRDQLLQADIRLLAGDGAPAIASAVGDRSLTLEAGGPIDPVAICRLALERADQGTADPPAPAYLRPPDARLPAPKAK